RDHLDGGLGAAGQRRRQTLLRTARGGLPARAPTRLRLRHLCEGGLVRLGGHAGRAGQAGHTRRLNQAVYGAGDRGRFTADQWAPSSVLRISVSGVLGVTMPARPVCAAMAKSAPGTALTSVVGRRSAGACIRRAAHVVPSSSEIQRRRSSTISNRPRLSTLTKRPI